MPNRPTHLAPAPSTDRPMTMRERRPTRASYEFWNTGDEALLKRAFAENFADRAVRPPCAGNDWFAAKQAPRGARKGVDMLTLKLISERINAWHRYREAARELSQFSDHELCDIGIRRCDIEDIVRRSGPRKADA
jgi:uncharacterized protein YjiS (DUF1127 family)